jgi:hypothetical protein
VQYYDNDCFVYGCCLTIFNSHSFICRLQRHHRVCTRLQFTVRRSAAVLCVDSSRRCAHCFDITARTAIFGAAICTAAGGWCGAGRVTRCRYGVLR